MLIEPVEDTSGSGETGLSYTGTGFGDGFIGVYSGEGWGCSYYGHKDGNGKGSGAGFPKAEDAYVQHVLTSLLLEVSPC